VYLLAFITAALASLVVTPYVVRYAVARGFYDAPSGGRRIHDRPIPRIGGVAVAIALLAGLVAAILMGGGEGAFLGRQHSFLVGLFLGAGSSSRWGWWTTCAACRPSASSASSAWPP
jgi:UDP-N-acetylmuramyl pentapeptide phosphotransferase/UDP-N-acetylglucosamine-1-phosphate transferase